MVEIARSRRAGRRAVGAGAQRRCRRRSGRRARRDAARRPHGDAVGHHLDPDAQQPLGHAGRRAFDPAVAGAQRSAASTGSMPRASTPSISRILPALSSVACWSQPRSTQAGRLAHPPGRRAVASRPEEPFVQASCGRQPATQVGGLRRLALGAGLDRDAQQHQPPSANSRPRCGADDGRSTASRPRASMRTTLQI